MHGSGIIFLFSKESSLATPKLISQNALSTAHIEVTRKGLTNVMFHNQMKHKVGLVVGESGVCLKIIGQPPNLRFPHTLLPISSNMRR